MMLHKERELLVYLALRVLGDDDYWVDFYKRDADYKSLVESQETEIFHLRNLILEIPFGPTILKNYDARKKDNGYTDNQEAQCPERVRDPALGSATKDPGTSGYDRAIS